MHNLRSWTVYDGLPTQQQQQMVHKETMVAIADGSGLHIHRNVCLEGQLKNVSFEADFLVCRISDDATVRRSSLVDKTSRWQVIKGCCPSMYR